MSKKIICNIASLLILICISSALPSCTRNNGYIGPIFGRWVLKSIDTQNYPEIKYDTELFWAFQHNIISMTESFPNHESIATFGEFTLEDNTLTINFCDPQRPINPAFGLPSQARLQVLQLGKGKLILEYNPTPDSSIVYTFHKW